MDALHSFWHLEPLRICTWLAALVVFGAAKAGAVISEQSVFGSLLIVLPILLGGEHARGHVVPLRKLVTKPEHVPADGTDARF